MSALSLVLMSVVTLWTLLVCFAVVLCSAAQRSDRMGQGDADFADVSVSAALASLATRP
jgi:hypothetical protein